MRIHVKFFAVLREAAGISERTLELTDGATVATVRERLATMHPGLSQHLPRVAYAVNQIYAPPETRLRDDDEVALIPPVSGG